RTEREARRSACCTERTLACHPRPFALRYRRARPVRSMAQLLSLCPLCPLCLCVLSRNKSLSRSISGRLGDGIDVEAEGSRATLESGDGTLALLFFVSLLTLLDEG